MDKTLISNHNRQISRPEGMIRIEITSGRAVLQTRDYNHNA